VPDPSARRPPPGPPLVFVADLAAPVLDDADAHHLGRVLRVRPGAAITIADGEGSWRSARFAGVGAGPQPDGPVEHEPRCAPDLGVGFALVKGERPELVVQKLTELGIDRITPFDAARSVVRWDTDKAARNIERFRRVAREAAMQCRRARLPVVDPPVAFAQLVARPGVALAARGGEPPTLSWPTVCIGPEGGWTDDELASARRRVALGEHVLRAETAAIAAGVVLAALRGALVDPAGADRACRDGSGGHT
jgi:16S rRNA (uracil1498-N3)-methyltransferase